MDTEKKGRKETDQPSKEGHSNQRLQASSGLNTSSLNTSNLKSESPITNPTSEEKAIETLDIGFFEESLGDSFDKTFVSKCFNYLQGLKKALNGSKDALLSPNDQKITHSALEYLHNYDTDFMTTLSISKYKPQLFLMFAKYEIKKSNTDYDLLRDLLNQLNKDLLNKRTHTFDRNGKTTELASQLEQYYAIKIKVNAHFNDNKVVIGTVDEALHAIKKLHYDNHIWFRRSKALALYKMGNVHKALKLMEWIVERKTDGFLKFELGSLYITTKQYKKGFSLIAQYLLSGQPIEFKVKVLDYCGANLKFINEDDELAQLHYYFHYLVRSKNSWGITDKLIDNLSEEYIEKFSKMDYAVIHKRLRQFWNKIK